MSRLRVIFVAALTPIPGGGSGGQLTSASLLLNSQLRDAVEFIPVSSSQVSVPPPSVVVRLVGAVKRFVRFMWRIHSADVALIFAGDGLGLIEKCLMCLLARGVGRGVVIRFGSGRIPEQCRTNFLVKLFLRLALKSAHVVCSQGPYWTHYFEGYAEGAGKVIEIPNGVVLKRLQVNKRISSGPPRITFAGSVVEEKGVFDLLTVLAALRCVYPDLRLSVAGGGRDARRFATEVRNMGLENSVDLLGWLSMDKIELLLEKTSVFLLPSHYEGMPNAVLEAMAAAVPVVATKVGALRNLFQNGENGFLVNPGDTTEMVGIVSAILGDAELARRIGEQARRTVEERHDMERIYRLYANALSHAAKATGRQGNVILEETESSLPAAEIHI